MKKCFVFIFINLCIFISSCNFDSDKDYPKSKWDSYDIAYSNSVETDFSGYSRLSGTTGIIGSFETVSTHELYGVTNRTRWTFDDKGFYTYYNFTLQNAGSLTNQSHKITEESGLYMLKKIDRNLPALNGFIEHCEKEGYDSSELDDFYVLYTCYKGDDFTYYHVYYYKVSDNTFSTGGANFPVPPLKYYEE